MKYGRLFKRVTALAMSAMMIIGGVPSTSLGNVSAQEEIHKIYTYNEETGEKYVADVDGIYLSDSNTINGWKNYFTDSSTEYAGAVWTDKAVFIKDPSNQLSTPIPGDFANLSQAIVSMNGNSVEIDANGNIVMTTKADAYTVDVADENFLVAMSALGSTKQITGYSALPSDTVFMLDFSNSMSNADKSRMIEATNKAIEKLLAVNNYNRVAVIVYDTGAETLLSIDRYSTTKTATDDQGSSYPVYVELTSNYGQLRTARTTTTSTVQVTVTNPTDAQWATILDNIPTRSIWQDRDDYRRAVANYFENALSEDVLGVDINWRRELNGNNTNNIHQWDEDQWREWLGEVVEDASEQTVTTTTTTIDLKDSQGQGVERSVSLGGATFIQSGIYAASELYKEIYENNDTSIDTGLIQGGTARIPIAVLMSDGAPTYATLDYTSASNGAYKIGGGGNDSIDDALVFPTQLTAAHLKRMMEEYYGREALFYTLGLGIEYAEANRVLNPSNNTSTRIDNYWSNYDVTQKNAELSEYSYGNQRITRLEGVEDSLTPYRYYVDEYFPADDADDLLNAFDSIVEAIIIQSKYYPTLVEASAHDFDGYLTFEDELGEHMEVKEIEGIVLGNTIYTGQAFLDALNKSDAFGNASTWSVYGNELLRSISERMGIQENEARTLLAAAYRAGGTNNNGQPLNQTGQLWDANYIGWYADETGKYLGHWDDELHTQANYPEGTAYLNKCYIFQGDLTGTTTSVAGGDMMHIVVQVHEEIATGHQCVIWKIPANLIPLVTYEISVDSSSLDTAENISLTMDTEQPIRLLYEVGLSDKINDVNMKDVVGAAHHSHPVKDASGNIVGYAFYSNRWGEGHSLDGSGATDILDPNSHLATVSHFHPFEQNERYYYVEDSVLYYVADAGAATDEQKYALYKADTAPQGGDDDFYHIYRIIEKVGEKYQVTRKFVPVAASVLNATGDMAISRIADATNPNNGAWYVPAGQIYQQIARHQQPKDDGNTTGLGADGVDPVAQGNVTQTIPYYDYPVIVPGQGTGYSIYDFLGNNGRLVKYLASGIKLTKTIDDSTAAGTVEFTFQVELSNAAGLKLCDANGNDITEASVQSGKLAVSGNVATVKIKNGETVHIMGLAEGTTYTVSEVLSRDTSTTNRDDYTVDDNYAVKTVKYNGVAAEVTTTSAADGTVITTTSKTPTYTINQYQIDEVEFVNTRTTHEGSLEIVKVVTHPYGDAYELASGLVFPVEVSLGTEYAGTSFAATGTVNNGQPVTATLQVDAEGKITLQMGHEDSVIINGIPEGTNYSVSEPSLASPWKCVTDPEVLSGVIVSDSVKVVELINELHDITPADTSDFILEITKEVQGVTEWGDGWTFEFVVEEYDASNAQWKNVLSTGETFKVTKDAPTVSQAGTVDNGSGAVARGQFPALGTYYYRVTEVVPDAADAIPGITYDATHRYFYFEVTDNNTDGIWEVEAKSYNDTTVITTNNGITTITAKAVNYYSSAVAEIKLNKNLINDTGVDVPLNSFEFEFCATNHAHGAVSGGNVVSCGDPSAHKTLTPNVDGNLTFLEIYTETEHFADVTEWDSNGTKTKTFTYYLWEKDGGAVGTTYDKSVYQIDVVVTVTRGDASNSIAVTSQTITKITDADNDSVTQADFQNAFVLDPVLPVSVKIEKTLNTEDPNRNIQQDEFTFELYKTNANFSITGLTPVTQSVGDGTAQTALTSMELFNTSTGLKAGTYYYVIKEQEGGNAAITYDPVVYYLTVVIGQGDSDGDGLNDDLLVQSITVNELGGAVTEYTTDAEIRGITLEFTNTYKVVQNVAVQITGDKDLIGKNLTANEYTFGLYNNQDCTDPVPDTNGDPITAGNLATSGGFSFTALEFSKTGTYTYFVKEEIPASRDTHVTYDESVYKVTITVTDTDGDGVLEAGQQIHKITGGTSEAVSGIKFINTYKPDPVSVVFKGNKRYVDSNNADISNWPTSGFTFELYVADSNFKVSNDVAATVVNGKKYVGEYTINAEGTDVSFIDKNNETADTGDRSLFELDLSFPAAGSYYYVLKEVEGSEPSLRYDTKEYRLTVIVTDYGDGVLRASQSMVYNGRAVTTADFTNVVIEQEVDVQIAIKKQFENTTGLTYPIENFQFGLYQNAECTVPVTDESGSALTSAAATNGDASFNMKYHNSLLQSSTPLQLVYYAKEIIPEGNAKVPGIIYDKSVYKVEVILSYDADHKFVGRTVITKIVDEQGNAIPENEQIVDSDNTMTFENLYSLDEAKYSITGTKELTGRNLEDGEFEFGLYEATVTTDADGKITGWTVGNQIGTNVSNTGTGFAFPEITYDVAGTHYYIVKEQAGQLGGITYDETEYRIIAKVVADHEDSEDDDEDGKLNDLVVKVSMEKVEKDSEGNPEQPVIVGEIVFTNTYASKGKFTISGTKELTGRDWKDSDVFTFELYQTDASYTVAAGTAPKAQAVVSGGDADKTFHFKDVEVAGVSGGDAYYFVIKEVAGNEDYMTYDTNEYHIKIDATDKFDGTLEFDVNQIASYDVRFENVYQTNELKVPITGTKVLTSKYSNRQIKDGEFSFALYEADVTTDGSGNVTDWVKGAQIGDAVSNVGSGFTFNNLTFTQAGEYYYSISEVSGGNAIIDYDTTEHRIKVEVSDIGDTDNDNKANLKADLFYIDAEGKEVSLTDQIAFNNLYNNTQVVIAIDKTITHTGDILHTLGGFEFRVKNATTGIVYDSKAVTDNNGRASFTIVYNENDIDKTYVYEISEVNTGIKDMIYDTYVHKLEVKLEVVNGQLTAKMVLNNVSVNDVKVGFINTYTGKTPEPDDPDETGEDVKVDNIPPKTGDDFNPLLYITLMAASALGLVYLFFTRKKKQQ
ncbi:MAG: hypothetical protein E7293_06695 [Lachnospiraceae bacterium]|nr:hypothetical protein [Lachnospiraceae bacterium]